MWQRVQTVFLLIAVISLVITIFLPIWFFQESPERSHVLYPLHYTIDTNGVRETKYFPFTITAIFLIAAATLAIIEIGKYKNRMLQIKLGALNALFLAVALCFSVYFAMDLLRKYNGGQYGWGLLLPGIAVVCNWLAMRFIRRDEKLVRDSDRLR